VDDSYKKPSTTGFLFATKEHVQQLQHHYTNTMENGNGHGDESTSSGSGDTDLTGSLTLPSELLQHAAGRIVAPLLQPPANEGDDNDDGVSTVATEDLSCSLTLPSTVEETKKPAASPIATMPDSIQKSPLVANKAIKVPPAAAFTSAGISAPGSQPRPKKQEQSSQIKIKSPKSPSKTNVTGKTKLKSNDCSLPRFLATTNNTSAELEDSCSMLSTKTDPSGGNTKQRSSARKQSEGSLLSPKIPNKAKLSSSSTTKSAVANNSPVRSGTSKSSKVQKIKKLASESNVVKWSSASDAELVAFACKVKEANLSMPPAAVIGDSGVGKSSLLSALFQITLPNNEPTRCPISIHMQHAAADHRQARVSVEWKSHTVADQYPEFPPVTVLDWRELPGTIRAAQEFILEQCQKPLTNDTIVLQVQGSDFIDFTAIDLPGTVTDDDEALRSDIAQLRHEYLPHAVILAVHEAATDWQNSPVIADALAVDSDGLRTIHCLTKPDLLADDADMQRLQKSIYREIRHIHIVKTASLADSSGADTFEDEQQFFGVERWRSMDKKGMLGAAALRGRLGSLQIDMIRDSLSSMVRKTKEKREVVVQQIGEIGLPFVNDHDRRTYYNGVCKSVVAALSSSLSGKGGSVKGRSVASRLHEDCSHFRDRILEGTLATVQTVKEGSFVLVSGRNEVVRGEVVHIDVEKGFACVDFVDEDGKRNKTLFDQVDMKAPEDIDENDVWAAGNRIFIGRANNRYDALRKIPLSAIRTDPSWLKPKMADEVNEDMPCFLNPETFKRIVVDNIEEDWRPHAMRLLDLVRAATFDAISDAINTHDDKRYNNLLLMLAKRAELALQDLLSSAHRQIQAHLEEEKHPFTQDLQFYSELALRRQNALKQRLVAALKFEEAELNDFSVVKGIVDDVFAKHSRRSGGDMLADDMESILSSYGSFAARRVLDRTPQICWQLLRETPTVLSTTFEQVTDNALRECLSIDQSLAAKQKGLSDTLHRLDRMLELYRDLS
jgi:Dynamin family